MCELERECVIISIELRGVVLIKCVVLFFYESIKRIVSSLLCFRPEFENLHSNL